MQIYGVPYPATFHQPQLSIPWQTTQPVFGNLGGRQQSMYSPCFGTPVAQSSAYNNQLAYPNPPRESQLEGQSSNHVLLPIHNLPQGATYSPNPGYTAGKDYYSSQQFHGARQDSTQHRPRTQCLPLEDTGGHAAPGIVLW